MATPRNIHVQLIVHSEVPLSQLVEAVCRHFDSIKGFNATRPHIYPEDPVIIECTEEIPNFEW